METFIKAISYYLPSKTISNLELENEFPDWSAEKVQKKIGIKERHVIGVNESVSDMAIAAAETLFTNHQISKNEIDYILLCTQSPDYFLPSTSCIIQHKLVYGLSIAKALVASEIAKNVLLITAESYSKFIHPLDKANRSIFGDAATATVISNEGKFKIGDFILGTDGSGSDNLIVKNGAGRFPNKTGIVQYDQSGSIYAEDYLYMRGSEIFTFTMEAVPKLIKSTLVKNNIFQSEIDFFIFHQANAYMLEHLRKKIEIPSEKFVIELENFGNTVSSTIPIAIDSLSTKNNLSSGSKN